jgi:hypothetical protein
MTLKILRSDGRLIKERKIGKDLEGSGHGLIGLLSGHLPGETEQNQNIPGQDSNQVAAEYKRGAFTLDQLVRSISDLVLDFLYRYRNSSLYIRLLEIPWILFNAHQRYIFTSALRLIPCCDSMSSVKAAAIDITDGDETL